MEEIWKDIEGYENLYQISNMGRVKRINYNKTSVEKLLKNGISKNGYNTIRLYKNGKSKIFYIHRLVAGTFIPNPENKPQVDHINCKRNDNRVENLKWCSNKENHNNPLTLVNHSKVNSKNHKPIVQLTMDGRMMKFYPSCVDAAKNVGTHPHNIRYCYRGQTGSAKGYRWLRYEDFERWY